jgi:hypothetical protein
MVKEAFRVPFLSSALRRAGLARQAFKAKKPMQAAYEGTGALADVVFPAWMGHEVYRGVKGQKMVGKELQRLHKRAGFIKEEDLIKEALVRAGLKVLKGAGKAAWKHKKPLALMGAGGTIAGAGALGVKSVSEAMKQKKRYGPQYRYGGQFA